MKYYKNQIIYFSIGFALILGGCTSYINAKYKVGDGQSTVPWSTSQLALTHPINKNASDGSSSQPASFSARALNDPVRSEKDKNRNSPRCACRGVCMFFSTCTLIKHIIDNVASFIWLDQLDSHYFHTSWSRHTDTDPSNQQNDHSRIFYAFFAFCSLYSLVSHCYHYGIS